MQQISKDVRPSLIGPVVGSPREVLRVDEVVDAGAALDARKHRGSVATLAKHEVVDAEFWVGIQ